MADGFINGLEGLERIELFDWSIDCRRAKTLSTKTPDRLSDCRWKWLVSRFLFSAFLAALNGKSTLQTIYFALQVLQLMMDDG